jgi:hypothetical protein
VFYAVFAKIPPFSAATTILLDHIGTAVAFAASREAGTTERRRQMGEILITHPLVILYLFYVCCMLPVLLWPYSPPRRSRPTQSWGTFGTEGRPGLGTRPTPPSIKK